jgi:site-specific DNA-methyltransferase (adenine-specific)
VQIAEVQIEKVRPYPGNPRKNAEAVAKVAASLATFGWRQPIVVDEEFVVIAGHTRLLAAQQLGHSTVPVHVATGLTPEQVRAYRLADNRVAQEAEWDDDLLAQELLALTDAGFDISLTGFDDDELAKLLADTSAVMEGADLDEVPEAPAEPITKPGERILLGRHTLVCGDSTDVGAWDSLLAGRQAGMVWTDPPYGVDMGNVNASLARSGKASKTRAVHSIKNDDLASPELEDFLRAALALAWANTRAGGAWYVAAPAGPLHSVFASVLHDLEVWRHTLAWVKDQFVLGRSDYHYRHEPIFYGWKEGAAHTWNGGRKQDSVLEIPRPRANKEHPTMKPVSLIQRCIENSSTVADLIVDPFGGSGSTLLAAEACGRSAALIELSPAYCDVIVKRWETATGKTAERQNV